MRRQVITGILVAFAVFSQAANQLPIDRNVRKGKLPNGLTYYIRHNTQTPNVADFYIAQRVGSILEEKQQRGLAHFLEHMAFNGTLNFPGDSIKPGVVKWCESVGIKFGQNLNAYTSVDETVYNISSAPVTNRNIVDSCLLILHDWSHSLLLKDSEIDKERGVVHEEWRTRRAGMAVQRLMEDAVPVIYKGTKYEDCLPIGNMDIVDNFKYKDLRDYYAKWYRPDLQAIIVVGDVNVDSIENKIKTIFGAIPAPVNPTERIYYPVNNNDSIIVFTAKDKEQPTVNFSIYMKRDATPRNERNSEANYEDGYKSQLIMKMLNDRLKEIVKQSNPPFLSSSARDGSFFLSNTKDAFSSSMMCKQDKIKEGIAALVAELQRARNFGFIQSELDRAKSETLRFAQNAYNSRDKKRNGHYVKMCLRNFLDEEPMMSAEDQLNEVTKLNSEIKLKDINSTVDKIITNNNEVVTIYGPDKNGFTMPSHSDIVSCIRKAQSKKYIPYIDKSVSSSLITAKIKAGKIVSEKDWKHGYKLFTLSNGMKVYVRPTDFEADRINLYAFSLGGKSLYPVSDMPNLNYIASSIAESGIGDFDATSLDKMLDGKTVKISPYIGEETEGLKGYSNIKDMKELFQLAHLYFTSPRKDKNAFASLMNRQSEFLTNRDANPSVSYNDSIISILYGNNPRMAPIKKESLPLVNYDRIMQIYKERFADASDFSVILTGNIDMKTIRPLICNYLASLKGYNSNEQIKDNHVYIRDANETHIFQKEQATPSSLTSVFIKAKTEYNADNSLLIDVMSQILRMMYTDKVREEKGGTYGVSVNGELERYPYAEALMKISFRTDPEKYQTLIPIIYEQLNILAKDGPSEENLNKVKEYEYKTYGQVKITNDYWNYIAYNELFNKVDFDNNYLQRVKSLTINDIRNFAKKMLQPNNRIEITMKSK